MAHGDAGTILRHIRTLIDTQATRGLTDGQLLQRFVARREETAFGALMQRHGRLVWQVCANILHQEQDIEDAFQATFMILARRAASICQGDSVGSWLYGVAYRVAMKAKKTSAKRRERERQAASPIPTEASDLALRELQAILSDELRRLPEKYRAPFVLCCLEGRGRKEAAKELGWKEGTVSSRIAHARERLRQRLARRGVALGAALCATELAPNPAAKALSAETVRQVLLFAAGKAGVHATAAALAHAVLQSMFAAKLKAGAALVLGLSLLAAAAGLAAQHARSSKPSSITPADPSQPLAERPDPPPPEAVKRPGTDLAGDPLPKGASMRLGTIRRRVVGAKLALTRDGKSIIGVRAGKYISIWDADSGKLRTTTVLPSEPRGLWVLSPFGRWLATDDGPNGTLTVWDVRTGKPVHRFAIQWAVQNFPVAFTQDEKLLGTLAHLGNDRLIRVWDLETEREVFSKPFATNYWTDQMVFTPDGKHLLLSFPANDLGMYCWEIAGGEQTWNRKNFWPNSMVFTPDGKILSNDKDAPVLDAATGERLGNDKMPRVGSDTRLALTPDGRTLLLSRPDGVVVWDLAAGKELRTIATAKEEALVSGDGKSFVTNDGLLERWDLASGKPLWTEYADRGHLGEVWTLRFSPDGKRLASAAVDGTVRLWDLGTGKTLQVWPGHPARRPYWLMRSAISGVRTLDFTPDGRRLVAGGSEDRLRLWDAVAAKELPSVPLPLREQREQQRDVLDVRISPDGARAVGVTSAHTFFAWGGQPAPETTPYKLATWDLKTGKVLRTQPIEAVMGVLSPDGRTLASGWNLIDVASGKVTVRLDGLQPATSGLALAVQATNGNSGFPCAFSSDGALLTGVPLEKYRNPRDGRDRLIPSGACIWETATGKKVAHIKTSGWPGQVAFHPSGRLIATNDMDGVQVFDVTSGKMTAALQLPEKVKSSTTAGSYASCLAFSPDGRSLATGLPDGTILLWDISIPQTQPSPLPPKELDRLWADLKEADAARAWNAVWRLADSPEAALALVQKRLKPTLSPQDAALRQWVADLDDDSFQRREEAAKRLSELGHLAGPYLSQALKANPSVEQRRRIEQILKAIAERRSPLSSEMLRELRAVAVLCRIGSAEARQVLADLAKGPEASPLTWQARAALFHVR
jgi:RNA polymerase sigma factor (sigma-70 family)